MKVIRETDRIILTEVTLSDAGFFVQLMNGKNWLKYIGDRKIYDVNDAENYINDSVLKSYDKNGFGMYVVRLKNNLRPIGLTGFVQRSYLDHPDIGFALLEEFEGNGYSGEASRACLDSGRQKCGLTTVYGLTTEENLASQHILNGLGLVRNGTATPHEGDHKFLLYIKQWENEI